MDERIRKRDDLPPLERAVSDTLDELLFRMHGITTSWSNPVEFIDWLSKRGYTIVSVQDARKEMRKTGPLKRYMVFAYDYMYPGGGWEDFQGDFNTMSEAWVFAIGLITEWDYEEIMILDTTTKKQFPYKRGGKHCEFPGEQP